MNNPIRPSAITVTEPECQVHVLFHDQPLRGPWGKSGAEADLHTAVFAIRNGQVSRVTGTVIDDRGDRRPARMEFFDLPLPVRQEVAQAYAAQMAQAEPQVRVV